ncbi:protein-glutamate methylesterase/protein-glutamine glutaminase [Crenobacter cavernae]|uniref:Protein-glutamate methylesterase/protein-glutamine glutaminase n=1 Tax=Crenobacter cavernae TaxID=2290923 RepID=A0A345Y6X3_9NEIS|nr:chemotaxis response regulator protein-glutamate methylesterase [Crenobacter cavernae]AXK39675.1 chemotaxis response regulator protein-glutamate methylesterase [Crenobacter cavernae]
MANVIRVVVVDDSALIRSLLTVIIDADPGMKVVATAADPLIARERIRETSPDVITLDVEMPRMDGLEFLRRLMRLKPTPVLMISSLTQSGSDTTFKALEFGAVDFLAKPTVDIARAMNDYADEIRDKIRAVAAARLAEPRRFAPRTPPAVSVNSGALRQDRLICIGASTGGTEALKALLEALPAGMPPILVVQHMPEGFTHSFAQRLDGACTLAVKEAEDGEPLRGGTVYIAPGHSHLRVKKLASGLVTALERTEPVNRHRPAVDVLFRSAAELPPGRVLGVILTGMGRDGAQGMRCLKEAGAYNLAQDEASCVVYGMPKEAVAAGGVDEILPLERIAPRLVDCLRVSRGT